MAQKPDEDLLPVPVDLPAGVTSANKWVFDFRDGGSFVGATRTALDPRLLQVPANKMKAVIYNRGNLTWTIRRSGQGGTPHTLGPGQSTLKLDPVTDYLELSPTSGAPSADDLDVTFLLPPFGNAARKRGA